MILPDVRVQLNDVVGDAVVAFLGPSTGAAVIHVCKVYCALDTLGSLLRLPTTQAWCRQATKPFYKCTWHPKRYYGGLHRDSLSS